MASIADLFARILLDSTGFEAEVRNVTGKAADTASQTMGQKFSKGFKSALAGASLGVAFTGAVEAAGKFEDQLRTINTVAKVSDEQLAAIGDDIQQLSRDSGKTTDDLTQGFYDLVSAGVPAEKAMSVLKDSAILATGSLGTTGEAVDLVTSALGAYGLAADKSGRVTDIFAQAVADGKTTVAALAQGISTVAPIAASAGVSLEEVAAATAVMTLKGDSASQAMTRVRNAISALLTPNETLNKIQERTGINFANLAKEKGLGVALEELRKATKGNNEEFAKALGSSEALTLAFSVTGDNAGALADELAKVEGGADKGGVALEQYTEKSKSAVEQGKRLIANIQTFIQDVGAPFVSSVGPMIFTLNELGRAFGVNGLLAKAFGGVVGALATRIKGPLTFFLKNVALGATAVFAKALDVAIAGTNGIASILTKGWRKVITSGPVSKVIGLAGAAAGTIYAGAVKVGERVGDALSAAWSVVGAIGSRAIAAAGLSGTAAGSAFAAAAAAAALAAPAIVILATIKWVAEGNLPDIVPGAKEFRDQVWGRIIKPEQAAEAARLAAEAATKAWQETSIATASRQGQQAAPIIMEKYGDAMIAAAKAQGPAIQQVVASSIAGGRGTSSEVFKTLGRRAARAIADGLRESRTTFDQGWQTFLDSLTEVEKPAVRAARLLGRLASKELAAGLNDERPEVRANAEAVLQDTIDELAKLQAAGGKIGKVGMERLRQALDSKNPDIRRAAWRIYKAATEKPSEAPAKYKNYGVRAGYSLAAGLRSQIPEVEEAAKALAGAAGKYLKISSPAEAGPWSESGGPEGWGKNLGTSIIDGIASTIPAINAAMGRLLRPGLTPLPSMAFAPARSGALLPGSTTYGGDTYQVNLLDRLETRSVRDIGSGLRMLGEQGHLVPKKRRRV